MNQLQTVYVNVLSFEVPHFMKDRFHPDVVAGWSLWKQGHIKITHLYYKKLASLLFQKPEHKDYDQIYKILIRAGHHRNLDEIKSWLFVEPKVQTLKGQVKQYLLSFKEQLDQCRLNPISRHAGDKEPKIEMTCVNNHETVISGNLSDLQTAIITLYNSNYPCEGFKFFDDLEEIDSDAAAAFKDAYIDIYYKFLKTYAPLFCPVCGTTDVIFFEANLFGQATIL